MTAKKTARALTMGILGLALMAALPAAAVELEARVWVPDVSGALAVALSDGQGTSIDLAADLALDEDGLTEARVVFRPSRRTWIRLGWASFAFAGDTRLDRTFDFRGETFEVDARVRSVLDFDYARLGFAWQFLSNPDGSVRFGPLVEIKGFRGDAGLTAEVAGLPPVSAATDFEAASGAAGVALDVEASRKLHVYAEWTTAVESGEGDLTDSEVGVRFFATRILTVTAGYRTLEFDLLPLELDGPFFGAGVSF